MSLVLVLCFVGVSLAQTAVLTAIRPQARQVLRRLRSPRLLLRAGCLLAGVLAVALPLFSLGGIWSWSWLSLLGADGGTLLLGTVHADEAQDHPIFAVAPYLFPLLAAAAMPVICLDEERLFRRGVDRSGPLGIAVRSVLFGVAHVVVGAPLAAQLALAGLGVAFAHEYRRAARAGEDPLLASATLHCAYNYAVIATVAGVAAWAQIASKLGNAAAG